MTQPDKPLEAAASAMPGKNPPRSLKQWGRFAVGLLLILTFAFVVIPWMQRLGPARELKAFILESDIQATGLFYTEVEQTFTAEAYVRDTLKRAGK